MTESRKKWKDPVSIVIPAYNEEERISRSLKTLNEFCKANFFEYEIICVDDGSTDATWDLISGMNHTSLVKPMRLLQNQGKGAAVKCGMLNARGEFCFFTDADLPYGLDAFTAALTVFQNETCDIVAGERGMNASCKGVRVTMARRIAGRIFFAMAACLVKMDVRDSQCGFKGFRKDAARKIFSQLQMSGYVFDVEMFALARAHRMKVCRIPVTLAKQAGSKIRLSQDPFWMFIDLIRLAIRRKKPGG